MKNNIYILIAIYLFMGNSISVKAQDLLDIIEKEQDQTPQLEIATFKATRISIGQSTEVREKGVFQLMAMSRSWNLPNQNIQSFVADKWSTRFGIDYSFTDRLTMGLGWTTLEDVLDGYLKYNIAKQYKNSKKHFASITFFQNISHTGDRTSNVLDDQFKERLSFTSQFLIARKFTPDFSLQISPTFIHRNSSAATDYDPNNHFALGFGGRYKIGNHVSIVSEYFYVANPLKSKNTYGAFALGVNWDVRFLMLQFQMTNTRSMTEDRFILQTPNNFNTDDGKFVFGFNAVFTLEAKKNKL